ncbi:TetR family transcriptional regulator [Nocardioides caeni]|uniref:TetR/AcrR family transcriptional regulator n=1 Tax=Nocardioides caeni TaxID=574700 RepID=A0A4S8N9C5_9ACTN|nr:TetR/AcrR family transcriptional regulator [Nocardioides caeni]THV12918.1 TetR/AcrR family transcriptional regulator [Nocardioides caeni]
MTRPAGARRVGRDEQAAERRTAVFAALRDLLLERPWGEVTLEAVAQDAGVSRQTLYNTFGSRVGLADAYTRHLADALCDVIADEVERHPGDLRAGLTAGLGLYLELAAGDPLVGRVRGGEAHHDLMRLVTTDAVPLLRHVEERIEAFLRPAWSDLPEGRVPVLAALLARMALSYVVTPPEDDESPAAVAAGLVSLLVPEGA